MKNNKKNKILLKIFKLQLWITGMLLLAYIISISIGGKGILLTDLNNKKRVAGATVSAMMRIFGPPETPIISGVSTCDASYNSIIRLNWPVVVDATSYDIYRDGVEIENGLVDNFFVDTNVFNENAYTYYVIASGPAGTATSDTVTVVVEKCIPVEKNFITINTFEGKNLSQFEGIPVSQDKRPIFSGLTNFENSIVEIEIYGEKIFFANTLANENGFWQWEAPFDLSSGEYDIYVKATNPLDKTISVSYQLHFKIRDDKKSKDSEDSDENDDSATGLSQNKPPQFYENLKIKKPFNFDISIENDIYIQGVNMASEAYRGESIKTLIKFSGLSGKDIPIEVNYTLINPDKEIVAQYFEKVILNDDLILEKVIFLPMELKLGKYKLKISATINGVTVSDERLFSLVDKPFIKIGSSIYLSYADLVNNLSWLLIVSSLFLSFFSVLAIWEHHLYKQALFHVTEKFLKRRGFIK